MNPLSEIAVRTECEHLDAANADIAVIFNAFYETDETVCRDLLGLSDAGPA